MRVAVHQPMLFPWIGYWNKVAAVDRFIHMDYVDASKGDYHNRFQIDGKKVTIPVFGTGALNSLRMDMRGLKKVTKTIEQVLCSRANPYRHRLEPVMALLEGWEDDRLTHLTQTLTEVVSKALGLSTRFRQPVVPSPADTKTHALSDLITGTISTEERIIYFSGAGGRNYLRPEEFDYKIKIQTVTAPYGGDSVLQLIAREEDPLALVTHCASWADLTQ